MDMVATIIRIDSTGLLVRDYKTDNKVKVIFKDSYTFKPGECVRIEYDGRMSKSIPPQITAGSIWEIECPD